MKQSTCQEGISYLLSFLGDASSTRNLYLPADTNCGVETTQPEEAQDWCLCLGKCLFMQSLVPLGAAMN